MNNRNGAQGKKPSGLSSSQYWKLYKEVKAMGGTRSQVMRAMRKSPALAKANDVEALARLVAADERKVIQIVDAVLPVNENLLWAMVKIILDAGSVAAARRAFDVAAAKIEAVR